MFIGEGPGFNEDQQGRPFVGPAGKLLDELLASIGIKRSDVFIGNMVKCRPPNNRDPLPSEIEACRKYLDRQIELIHPEVIVALGRHALAKFLPKEAISKVHGKPRRWGDTLLYPMYHPAAALHQGGSGLRKMIEEDFRRLPELLKEAQRMEAPKPSPVEPQSKQMQMF